MGERIHPSLMAESLAREIRGALGEFNNNDLAVVALVRDLAKSNSAHLTQPAQAVDVGEPSKQEVDALSRCVGDLERFIELAKDYDLDEMAVQSLQTAIESMQMRASRAIGNAQADGWRPIETAPKDGTRVDLWHPLEGRHTDYYYSSGRWTHDHHGADPHPSYTNWMPLPTSPTQATPNAHE